MGHWLTEAATKRAELKSNTLKPFAEMELITLLLGLLVVPVLSQDACEGGNTCCGGDSCCDNKPGGCLVGEGDCDNDSHCKGDLVCGMDNCGGETGYDGTDDCCMASPVPAPVPAPAPDNETFTFSCNQMRIAHHGIVRAQLSYTCSCQSYTGETTACDREVLIDLLKCGGDDPLCIFKAFNRTSCLIEGKMDYSGQKWVFFLMAKKTLLVIKHPFESRHQHPPTTNCWGRAKEAPKKILCIKNVSESEPRKQHQGHLNMRIDQEKISQCCNRK